MKRIRRLPKILSLLGWPWWLEEGPPQLHKVAPILSAGCHQPLPHSALPHSCAGRGHIGHFTHTHVPSKAQDTPRAGHTEQREQVQCVIDIIFSRQFSITSFYAKPSSQRPFDRWGDGGATLQPRKWQAPRPLLPPAAPPPVSTSDTV